MTRWPTFVREWIRHPAAVIVAVFALSCLGDSSGPNVARPGYFQLAPSFETAVPSGLVTLDRVRILLFRAGSTTVALDTTARIAPTDTDLDLNLTVPVFTAADTFTAHIALITPAGDTAFRGGPLTVIGRPARGSTNPLSPAVGVTLTYTGVGAGADSVVITTTPSLVVTGDTVLFTAVAFDNDKPVPGTPIGWTTLDPTRASVPFATQGRLVGGSQRGAARMVARTLTGQADTASVTVHLGPAVIQIVSGNNQTAVVRSPLSSPVVAQLKASDSLPVPGAWIKFAVQSGGGTISADSALTDANGLGSIQWTLGAAGGVQQLRAAPAKAPTLQTMFSATGLAGQAASIAAKAGDGQTAKVGTAVATAPAIVVTDADGNPVPGLNVTFFPAAGGGSATGANQLTDASGVATVGSWTLGTTAGPNTLTAHASNILGGAKPDTVHQGKTSTTDTLAKALIVPINLNYTFTATAVPAGATTLDITGLAASVPENTSTSFTVTAHDAFGNVVTGYTGTVHFASSDQSATLPADYTFKPADAGTHTFSVSFKTPGPATVTATDFAQVTITGTANTDVTTVQAPHFDVSGLSASYVAGSKGTLVVTAKDGSGNTITNYTGMVRFDSNDPLATLPVDYRFVAGDNGTHTFSSGITLRTAGARDVLVTDVDVATITGAQAVTVVPTAPAYFLVNGIPNPADPGVSYDVTVAVKDSFSNTATGYTGTIRFQSTDLEGSVPLDYQFTPGDNGVHVFSRGVTFNTPGLQAVTVEDTNDQNLAGGISTTVTGGLPATHLRFVSPPQNTPVNSAFAPIHVAALDDAEQPVSGFTGAITVSILNNPVGGSLRGTTTVAALGGLASFSDLSIDVLGTGYTLQASAAGLASDVSPSFDVTSGGGPIIHWTNLTGGNWSVGSNWDAGRAPLASEIADITADGTYTVNLDVSTTVQGLTVGASTGTQTLSSSVPSLAVNGDIDIGTQGVIILAGTTIGGSGNLTNQGQLLVHGNVTINPAITTAPGSTLRIEGISGSAAGNLITATDLVNLGTIELTDVGASFGASLTVSSGSLTNVGTFDVQVGGFGSRILTAQLDNQGQFYVNRALTINATAANHSNSGAITLAGTTLTVTGGGTFTNTSAPGTIQGTGTLDVSGTTFSNAGIIDPGLNPSTPGTLAITGNVTFLPTSVVHINLASPTVYDVLAISGTAAAAGDVNMDFGYALALLESFTPVTWGSYTGTFNVTGAGLLGHVLGPVFNALNLVINVIA